MNPAAPADVCAVCGTMVGPGDPAVVIGGRVVCSACQRQLAAPARPGVTAPDYVELVSASRQLYVLATITGVIGGLCLLGALALLLGMVVVATMSAGKNPDLPAPLTFLVYAGLAAGAGLVFVITSAVLRVLSALALAHRDLARNSFERIV
jgi:hypothetical protein